jgi:hypothetical protein
MRIRESIFGGLSISATDAVRKVAAIIGNYRPQQKQKTSKLLP